jgi:hypothetical protein
MTHAQRGGGAGQLKLKHFKGLLNQHLFHWSSTDMYIWGYSQHCEHFFKLVICAIMCSLWRAYAL